MPRRKATPRYLVPQTKMMKKAKKKVSNAKQLGLKLYAQARSKLRAQRLSKQPPRWGITSMGLSKRKRKGAFRIRGMQKL